MLRLTAYCSSFSACRFFWIGTVRLIRHFNGAAVSCATSLKAVIYQSRSRFE